MTEKTAQRIADAALGAAALGAAYYVIRTPPLRRFVIGLAMTALTGALPALVTRELQRAWVESGRRRAI
jgi:hypothetical protein